MRLSHSIKKLFTYLLTCNVYCMCFLSICHLCLQYTWCFYLNLSTEAQSSSLTSEDQILRFLSCSDISVLDLW